MSPRIITARELAEHSGKNGMAAYVAYKGKVYDVSLSPMWVEGVHRVRHPAGKDLTGSMADAPHGEEVFGKFPVVGELGSQPLRLSLQQRLEMWHLHGLFVHFSVAFSYTIVLLAVAFLLTGEVSFERASYYLLTLLLVVTPFSGLSGFFSWKVTYEGRQTRTFTRKQILTVVSVLIVAACFAYRYLVPDVLIQKTLVSYLYLVLLIGFAAVTTALGHYGGRLVYP